MKQKLLLLIALVVLVATFVATPVYAADPTTTTPTTAPASGLQAPSGLQGPSSLGDLIGTVTNLLLGIAGSVAVIFIIVGAIQYSTSAGNEQSVQKAKSTITSAVIGLIIAILALGIVNFILITFK